MTARQDRSSLGTTSTNGMFTLGNKSHFQIGLGKTTMKNHKSVSPTSTAAKRTKWTIAVVMAFGCLFIAIVDCSSPDPKIYPDGGGISRQLAVSPKPTPINTNKPTTSPATTPPPKTTTGPTPTTTKKPAVMTSSPPTSTPNPTPTKTPKISTPLPTRPNSSSIPTTSPSGTPRVTANVVNKTSTPTPAPVLTSTAPKPSATMSASNATTKPPKPSSSTAGSVTNSSTPIPTVSRPSNTTIIPTPSSSLVAGNRTNGTSTTPRPVNVTTSPTNTTNSTIPCALSLCGAKSCRATRELRIASGTTGATGATQPTNAIEYEICSEYGFYGQIKSTNVKPTTLAKDATGTKDLAGTQVADAPACAKRCLAEPNCQWFTLTDKDKLCELYQDVQLGVADQDKDGKPRFVGFLKAASPNELNRQMVCAQKREMSGAQGSITLCRTASGWSVLPDPVNECGTGPWTLYRGYLNKGKLTSSSTINFNEFEAAFGDPEKYFKIITEPTPDVTIATRQFAGSGKPGGDPLTTWTFKYDKHGRVVSAEGSISSKNLVNGDYRDRGYQDRFRDVHHQTDSRDTCMSFAAGHVVANEFTNPNSFWNFVPQSNLSNSGGCWQMAEKQIGNLLELGCTGKMKAEMQYFEVNELKTINGAAQTKLATAHAEDLMTIPVNDLYNPSREKQNFVSYPCNYFYRPFFMNLEFQLVSADPNSACAKGWHALDGVDKKFFSMAPDDSVTITRVMADWSMSGGSSNFAPIMGFATNKVKKCLADTGAKLDQLTFSNAFKEAYLLHRKSKKCVVCNAATNALDLEDCNPQSPQQKWTAAEGGSLGRCNNARFLYDFPRITYDDDNEDGPKTWTSVTLTNGRINIGGTNVTMAGSDEIGVVYDYTKTRDGKPADGSKKRKEVVVESCYETRSKKRKVAGN